MSPKLQSIEWINKHHQIIRQWSAPVLAALIGGVYGLVYTTGGIKYVYSHSMYLPILLAGFIFGDRGGILTGLVAGLALGPFMPIDTITGEPQRLINWLYRTGFFTLIGWLSGIAADNARIYIHYLQWVAKHDPSTKLPNQVALLSALTDWRAYAPGDSHFMLAVISIENHMELRSAFGIAVIDAAISQLFKLLARGHFRGGIYRVNTAQLALLLVTFPNEADSTLDELFTLCLESITYKGIQLHIDIRIGYVCFDQLIEPPALYLQQAEAALTVARMQSHNYIAYNPAIIKHTEENLAILGELKTAIDSHQLLLHYQPKILLATSTVYGVEALLRWPHPQRGNIPPGTFIPRAEQSTLIQVITEFVLDLAMTQLLEWQQAGIIMPVAVNITPRNLTYPGFITKVLQLLDKHSLSGNALELEITERALMLDIDHVVGKLATLANANIIISVDDFGTGYSSLQYLHRLPISLVKIDKSFINRLLIDTGAVHIVQAAVSLSHNMGIKALAEGIENTNALPLLQAMGCDMAQGFCISRPLPPSDFVTWYKNFPFCEND